VRHQISSVLSLVFLVSNGGDSGEDDMFDCVVGKLEEILMGSSLIYCGNSACRTHFQSPDERFNDQLGGFMRSHCTCFDRSEEHKLEYMDIFQRYVRSEPSLNINTQHHFPPNRKKMLKFEALTPAVW